MMDHVPAQQHASSAPLWDQKERTFEHNELIYSRSDERGIVQSGNGVFQRMCGYPWPDLIGAPHRILRHPDMPKAFFYLLWAALKQGDPVVGYVKNKAIDGSAYWVLATLMPCDGGYFSVRLRPSSPLFAKVKDIYARHLKQEQSEGLSPEASAKVLLGRLVEMGFGSHEAFAAHALSEEIHARNLLIGRRDERTITASTKLIQLLEETLAEQSRLIARFSDLLILPVNMRLAAARLEPQGGPISQISVNYKLASEEISRRLASFVSGKQNLCAQMAHAVRRSLMLSGCARLQDELVETYDRKTGDYPGVERRKELEKLETVRDQSRSLARAALDEAAGEATVLREASNDLRRMILGLDTIRILARVESRKSVESQDALNATIDKIDTVQGSISDSLKVLIDRTAAIDSSLAELRGDKTALAAE